MREIDDEIRALHDRIGVQGHTYGFHGKNDVRDPMRKVDDMIDGTIDLEVEREQCRVDIAEAVMVIEGMRAMEGSGALMTDCEYVLSAYYVYAKTQQEIASDTGHPASLCMRLIREAVRICDEVGMAGLMAARRRS